MKKREIFQEEPICALASASGEGAIALLRVSGRDAIDIVNSVFRGKDLTKARSHTVHFGTIRDGDTILDEVLVTIFRSPSSYTREDLAEISCHGSPFIIRNILRLLLQKGARLAQPGEFTQRAYLNGQLDLVQAEAVADLIAADSEAGHRTALHQLRGGFSKKLNHLREELIHFASLIELELDFGEEDVEFAGRSDLKHLVNRLLEEIQPLIDSFNVGNALKEGIPVAIIGAPNVGKSTLLNTLLNEEKAIVTDVAGTTRDVIEDTLVIQGIKFRIIDTAGIRHTIDLVESIGIDRSKKAMEQAGIVLFVFDSRETLAELLRLNKEMPAGKQVVWVRNKTDKDFGESINPVETLFETPDIPVNISAKTGDGLEDLKEKIAGLSAQKIHTGAVVTNLRHYEHLVGTQRALLEVLTGIDGDITGDFLAQDIRLAQFHLGEITATIASDDLLANIFSRFCIGK